MSNKPHPVHKLREIFPCNYFMKYCPAGHYSFLGYLRITKGTLNSFFKITKQEITTNHINKQKKSTFQRRVSLWL